MAISNSISVGDGESITATVKNHSGRFWVDLTVMSYSGDYAGSTMIHVPSQIAAIRIADAIKAAFETPIKNGETVFYNPLSNTA